MTALVVLAIIAVYLIVLVCRLLAAVIRDVNIWDRRTQSRFHRR